MKYPFSVGLFVFAALGLATACHSSTTAREEPSPVAVHCVAAKRAPIAETETLYGRVSAPPGGDLPVASQVAGRVVVVAVREGAHVAPGDVIATIDDSATRDALKQAEAAVLQAKATTANADATLARTRELVARGIAARQELDDAVARADQAHAGENASIAASDLARRTLGRVQVRSTFGGVVTRVWRGPGALVDGTAATPIAQLAATDLAEFDADATERQIVAIAPGQAAHVTVAGAGASEGTVRARPTALDPASGLGLVRIDLPGADRATWTLGTFGAAAIAVGAKDAALVVPDAAIRGAVADGAELVVCKNGKAELRAVEVGARDGTSVEIVKGLADGEAVAVDHVLGLEDGTPLAEAK